MFMQLFSSIESGASGWLASNSFSNAVSNHFQEVLVTFAIEQEAKPFRRFSGSKAGCNVLVTGIGRNNAEKAIKGYLESVKPQLVLTCGFAGGLNPALKFGEIVFDTDEDSALDALESVLPLLQCKRGKFLCSDKIVVSAAEKKALWLATKADAVEMESGPIREFCRKINVPSATIRIISDTAEEDLPLDFNELFDKQMRPSALKASARFLRRPKSIGKMLSFMDRTRQAASSLSDVLASALERIM